MKNCENMTDEQKAGVLFLYEENKRLEAEVESALVCTEQMFEALMVFLSNQAQLFARTKKAIPEPPVIAGNSEIEKLRADIEQLRTALAIYGHHSKNCASVRKGAGAAMVFPCDCGLDKALGAE